MEQQCHRTGRRLAIQPFISGPGIFFCAGNGDKTAFGQSLIISCVASGGFVIIRDSGVGEALPDPFAGGNGQVQYRTVRLIYMDEAVFADG